METIVLNYYQEKEILLYALNQKLEDAGAARMVFELDKALQHDMGLDMDRDYVIKIPMGIGGYRQTQLEIKTYLEYGNSYPLAEIAAYGHFVEIMEKVDVEDYRDFADSYSSVEDYIDDTLERYNDETDEDFEKRYKEATKTMEEVADVISQLENLFGCTGDNGQIGKDRFGYYVAYDYGFTTEESSCSQTSNISDEIGDANTRARYLKGLIDLLNSEEAVLEHYEKVFLYDENGDETYTRYEGVVLVDKPHWMTSDYDYTLRHPRYCSLEDFRDNEINTDHPALAYQICEVIYDLDGNPLHRELIETNIPAEYAEIWNKLIAEGE